jgi:enoyl-CoA hydratase/carnithine racemase
MCSTPTCKGVILTGDGKFFSNGLDLKWLESVSADGAGNEIIMQFSKGLEALIHRLLLFPLPTIAAINGNTLHVRRI